MCMCYTLHLIGTVDVFPVSMATSVQSTSPYISGAAITYSPHSAASTHTPSGATVTHLFPPPDSGINDVHSLLPLSSSFAIVHTSSSLATGATVTSFSLPLDATATPHPSVVPHVKLPKLSIRKFNGGLTKWVTFWDSYNSSIHLNPLLSSIDKFNYLVLLVESLPSRQRTTRRLLQLYRRGLIIL